ncbi:MAG TPA: hypothetical protein GXZ60_15095 [Intrasporangiaceae bacterium]|nr:hypothetical protein [Intrasporangiaceae bacterium]
MSPIHEDDLRAALRNDPHHPVDAHALAAEVTARGRRVRRRRRVIGALGAAAAAAVVVVAVNQMTFGPPTAFDPAGTGTHASQSLSTEPSIGPTTEPPVDPTTGTPTDGATTSGPEQTHTDSESGMPTLLHEGATLADLEAARPGIYQGNDDFAAITGLAGDLQPCHGGPQDVPLQTPVVESKAVGQGYGSGTRGEGLIVLADADLAQAAMAEMRERFGCGDAGHEEYPNTATYPLDGPWGEAFRTNVWSQGPGFSSYHYVVRVGRAIMWSELSGDGGVEETQPSSDVDAILREPLDHLYPLMCRYTVAGCTG